MNHFLGPICLESFSLSILGISASHLLPGTARYFILLSVPKQRRCCEILLVDRQHWMSSILAVGSTCDTLARWWRWL